MTRRSTLIFPFPKSKIQMTYTKNFTAKPFLKWAGGKGQLIEQLRARIPESIKRSGIIEKYIEPFVGGGAVFFWLAQEYRIKKAYLYDINQEIILAYQTIKQDVEILIHELGKLQKEYLKRGDVDREDFYYDRRHEYNGFIKSEYKNNIVRRTALIVFLNKTCFNGLFRVNSQGLFNVPFGRYSNPTICDVENLLTVSKLLQSAEIRCADFSKCIDKVDNQSLVYLDPPYRPISATANFTNYSNRVFDDTEQKRLKQVIDTLNKKSAFVMLSNSDPKNNDPKDNFFDVLYQKYNVNRLKASRMINCNAERRGLISEILVTNY